MPDSAIEASKPVDASRPGSCGAPLRNVGASMDTEARLALEAPSSSALGPGPNGLPRSLFCVLRAQARVFPRCLDAEGRVLR
eukprot:3794728-Lingulodinium_polyedra.AAC.1